MGYHSLSRGNAAAINTVEESGILAVVNGLAVKSFVVQEVAAITATYCTIHRNKHFLN